MLREVHSEVKRHCEPYGRFSSVTPTDVCALRPSVITGFQHEELDAQYYARELIIRRVLECIADPGVRGSVSAFFDSVDLKHPEASAHTLGEEEAKWVYESFATLNRISKGCESDVLSNASYGVIVLLYCAVGRCLWERADRDAE
jgi:hypothetical protein